MPRLNGGIQLEQRTVSSDTEMLLAFRAMVPHIDGFVFLPDETILSPKVIQQVLNHGRRNGVQILVYSPVMFNLGASLYLQPDPVRVADALVTLVNDPDTRPQVTCHAQPFAARWSARALGGGRDGLQERRLNNP